MHPLRERPGWLGRIGGYAGCLVWLFGAAPSMAEQVVWGRYDLPPIFILAGALAGNGYGDRTIAHMARAAPDLSQTVIDVANNTRLERMARSGETVCHTTLLRTPEREAIFVFSDVAAMAPANGVIVAEDWVPRLAWALGDDVIHLDRLGQLPMVTGAAALGRSYGPAIDGYLVAVAGQARQQMVSPANQVFAMLLAGRVDFAFGRSFEVAYHARWRGAAARFRTLPVAGAEAYTESFIACAKTTLGRRMIDRVNDLLREDDIPFAARFLMEWLGPADLAVYRAEALPRLTRARAL